MDRQDGMDRRMESIGEKEQVNVAFCKSYLFQIKNMSAPNCVMVPFYTTDIRTYIRTYIHTYVQLSSSSEMVRK